MSPPALPSMPQITEFAALTTSRLVFYPSVLYNVIRSRVQSNWNWYDAINQHLILGALPNKSILAELKEQGVKAVVTLNQPHELFVSPAEYQELGFAHLWLRTTDYLYAPSMEELHRGVAFIAEHVARNDKVYVHCKAGRGRSTTLLLCYLIKQGMTVDDAWALVLGKRPQVCLAAGQWAAVRAFAADCRSNGAAEHDTSNSKEESAVVGGGGDEVAQGATVLQTTRVAA